MIYKRLLSQSLLIYLNSPESRLFKKDAQSFQRLIVEVLRGLSFIFAYIDDVLIGMRYTNEHMEYLKLVFENL